MKKLLICSAFILGFMSQHASAVPQCVAKMDPNEPPEVTCAQSSPFQCSGKPTAPGAGRPCRPNEVSCFCAGSGK